MDKLKENGQNRKPENMLFIASHLWSNYIHLIHYTNQCCGRSSYAEKSELNLSSSNLEFSFT